MNQVKYAHAPSFVGSPQKNITRNREKIYYPESDGKPRTERTSPSGTTYRTRTKRTSLG